MRNHLALSLFLLIGAISSGAQQAVPDFSKMVGPRAMCEAAATKLRDSGTDKVVLMLTLGTTGRVESFQTESPKGLKLEAVKEAATAIKKLKFEPATKDGLPVRVKGKAVFDCSQQPGNDSNRP